MSISEYVAKYTAFLNAVLAMGPDIPEMLACLQRIRDESMNLVKIATRRFGYKATRENSPPYATQWQQIATPEVKQLEQSVVAATAEHGGLKSALPHEAIGDGSFLRALFDFLVANPAILTFILNLFKTA